MCDALKELMRPEFEEELAAELKNNTDRVTRDDEGCDKSCDKGCNTTRHAGCNTACHAGHIRIEYQKLNVPHALVSSRSNGRA